MSLYGALLTEKYSKARRLIHRRAGINTPGEDGETPLMLCAQHPDMIELTRILRQAGADVNARNNNGETALIMSLGRPNNLENVALLLENGADASMVNVYGYMARDFALYDAGVVFDGFFPENAGRRVIRQKAEAANATGLEQICQEQPIDNVLLRIMLNETMYSEEVDRVEVLLKFGVPVDSPTICGSTALFYAACRIRLDLVKLLLRYGANPSHQDSNGMTALMEMKTCFPGSQVTELLYGEDYALELLGMERMEEIAAVKQKIERLLGSIQNNPIFT